ncbi:MAG TPA: hypothetical protein VN828_18445, partial [Acidobacteriaceae bacterium]|nr:hypothetical protein [Acidobacteriaceae bacterium]
FDRSPEPQISPLRYAPVEMANLRRQSDEDDHFYFSRPLGLVLICDVVRRIAAGPEGRHQMYGRVDS